MNNNGSNSNYWLARTGTNYSIGEVIAIMQDEDGVYSDLSIYNSAYYEESELLLGDEYHVLPLMEQANLCWAYCINLGTFDFGPNLAPQSPGAVARIMAIAAFRLFYGNR